jgi:hypothetical protein
VYLISITNIFIEDAWIFTLFVWYLAAATAMVMQHMEAMIGCFCSSTFGLAFF